MADFIQENEFIGPQLVAQSSGRITIDATNDIIMSSGRGNGMTFKTDGNGIHFNITDNGDSSNFKVNSPKVYLGPTINNVDPNIPAVKSDELIRLLKRLTSNLRIWFDTNYPQTSGIQGPNMAINSGLKSSIVGVLEEIENSLDQIKSDTVYIS